MKKKYIFIACAVIALLLLLIGLGLGAWYIYDNYIKKETTDTTAGTELNEDEAKEILDEAVTDYTEVNSAKAVGTAEVNYGGETNEVEILAMTKNKTDMYLELTMKGEKLYVYSEIDPSASSGQEGSEQVQEEDIIWAFVSDGVDTVRFEITEGSEGEDIYNDVVNSTNPMEMMEDLEEVGEEGLSEDPSVEISYEGVEACRDMECHKYIITDKETDGTITVWVDTDGRLPRIAKYDSSEVKGTVDIYYEEVDFEIPTEYEDIDLETFWGLQTLYLIAGDFVDLFW
jgi:hypothetical protein